MADSDVTCNVMYHQTGNISFTPNIIYLPVCYLFTFTLEFVDLFSCMWYGNFFIEFQTLLSLKFQTGFMMIEVNQSLINNKSQFLQMFKFLFQIKGM